MLCDGKRMTSFRLTVPARDARQAMRDIADLDIQRRWIEQIETPPAQHPLPSAARLCGDLRSSAHGPSPDQKNQNFVQMMISVTERVMRTASSGMRRDNNGSKKCPCIFPPASCFCLSAGYRRFCKITLPAV